MKRALQLFIFLLAGAGLFLFANTRNTFNFAQVSSVIKEQIIEKKPIDLPPQKPLENPPEIIKAVYATGWSAGSPEKMAYLIGLIKKSELNAVVIDIKDYSGELSYGTDLELVKKYGAAKEIKIPRPNSLIKQLHDEGIYVIARQTIFQDPVLAAARPDLALTSSSTGKQWKDYKGLMWIDPAGQEAWDYNIAIAKDALERGFDEVNFDYIRFASDGDMDDVVYPFWDEKTYKRYVMRDFFKYLRKSLPEARLSADLFGYTTLFQTDLGIGQNIDDTFHYFDAIAPMVYPSHYNKWFNGYENPADYPYEVVYASISEANARLQKYIKDAAAASSTEKYLVKEPQLRPWLQDFDLGAEYDAEKVRAQIDAAYASVATGTPIGWMLWNASNIYTREALQLSD